MENENQENVIINNNPITIPVDIEQMNNHQGNMDNKNNKLKKKIVFIILGIIVIALIVILLYFTLIKKEEDKTFTPSDDVSDEVEFSLKIDAIVIGTNQELDLSEFIEMKQKLEKISELEITTDNPKLAIVNGTEIISKDVEGTFNVIVSNGSNKINLKVTINKMVDNIFDSLEKQENANYTNHIVETSIAREDGDQRVHDYTIFHDHQKGAEIELYSDCDFVSDYEDIYNSETKKANFDALYEKISSDEEGRINISDLFKNNIKTVELKDDVYTVTLIDDSNVQEAIGDYNSVINNVTYYLTFESEMLKILDIKIEYKQGYYKEYYQSNEFTFYETGEPQELTHMKICMTNLEKIKNIELRDNFQLKINGKNLNVEVKYTIDPIDGETKEHYFQNYTLFVNNNIIIDNEYSDFIAKKDYLENYSEFKLNDLNFKIKYSDFQKITISGVEYFIYDKEFSQSSRPVNSETIRLIDDSGKELLNFDDVAWNQKIITVKKDNASCNVLGYDCKENQFIKYNDDNIQYIDIDIDNKKVLEKELTIKDGEAQERIMKEYNFDDVVEEYLDF